MRSDGGRLSRREGSLATWTRTFLTFLESIPRCASLSREADWGGPESGSSGSTSPPPTVIISSHLFRVIVDVTHVEEGRLVHTDIDEGSLHPGENTYHPALVNVSGNTALSSALDIEFPPLPRFRGAQTRVLPRAALMIRSEAIFLSLRISRTTP